MSLWEKKMKGIKRIFVLASLFLPLLSAGAFGAQEIAIQADTILPISDAPIENGTTNWPAVMEVLDEIGYRGYLTFEYFHPYTHYPEALIYQTSDSLDRILGRIS